MPDILENKGVVRTDMNCHECSKTFIAELDCDIDGNHIAICPYCGHEHYRTIEKGKITESRWVSGGGNGKDHNAIKSRVWKHDVLKMKTSSACAFIRDKWLNFGFGEGEL